MKINELAQKSKVHIDYVLHPRRMWFVLACLVLAASLALVLVQPYRRGITLWFPDVKTGKLQAEFRFVPASSGKAGLVERVMEELLLGPAGPRFKPLADQSSKVLSVIPTKERYYIVLASSVVFEAYGTSVSTDFGRLWKAISRTLVYNTGIRHFSVVLEGKEVFSR